MSINAAYIDLDNVITDAAQELRDADFGKLGKPFYRSAAQRALQAMGFDTYFDRQVWETAIPEDLIIQLPEGVIGLETAWLFNGDQCNYSQSTILYIKPTMVHKGGSGYLANNTFHNHDQLQYSFGWQNAPLNWGDTSTCFAGEMQGKLYLSQSCSQYQKLHINYNGLGVECFGEDFKIPQWAREAVTDFMIHRAALALEQDNLQYYRGVIARKEIELKAPNGSWSRANYYWKRMDKKTRRDTVMYNTRFGVFP